MQRFYYSAAYLLLLGVPALMISGVIKNHIDFRAVFVTTLLTIMVGGIFDIWAVRQSRKDKFFIWEYNKKSIIGVKVFGVPIEDYVFFLVLTPIFIIALYEGVRSFFSGGLSIASLSVLFIFVMLIAYTFVYRYASKKRS